MPYLASIMSNSTHLEPEELSYDRYDLNHIRGR